MVNSFHFGTANSKSPVAPAILARSSAQLAAGEQLIRPTMIPVKKVVLPIQRKAPIGIHRRLTSTKIVP